MHHPHLGSVHAQQLDRLACRELRDCDDAVAARGRVARLFREPPPELRRRVFARQHKQIVESGDRATHARVRQPLVQTVKHIRPSRRARLAQQEAPGVGRQALAQRTHEPVRPVAECEPVARVRAREAVQHLPRIYAHSGQVRANTVRRIQRDVQFSILYSLSLR